jgi:transcriptional regulator with XRE-family HTH domain
VSLGSEIAKLRAKRGWSRARLNAETGISTSYLHYVEHDQLLPAADKVREIVTALDGDPEPLVRLRDEIELRRLNADADTVLLLRDEFGELSDEERDAVRRAVRRVRSRRGGGS